MSAMLSGPLAQAIGWALLHQLWQGVLVAAILAASLTLLQRRSANARYLASCAALVVVVVLSAVTAVRAYHPVRAAAAGAAAIEPGSGIIPIDVATTAPAAASGRLATAAVFVSTHMPQIVLVWLIGVTLLSTRLAFGWLSAHRLASVHARRADGRWELAMMRIANALDIRRTIELLESTAVEVPTVVGWLRPAILLPIATVSGLSPEQIEMILAHELAHIRRHDFIVNLVQSSVETLFFYQPAVWWISRRIRVEREHCCDDIAVAVSGDPIRYARALTRFEELRIDAAQTMVAASGGSLLMRIRRLVGASGESAAWSSRWAAGAGLLVVVVALLLGPAFPLFAGREEQPPKPKAPKQRVAPAPPAAKSEIEVKAGADLDDDSTVDDIVDAATAAAGEAGSAVDIDVPEPPEPPEVSVAPMAMIAPAIAAARAAAPRVHILNPMLAARATMALAPMAPIAWGDDEPHHKIADESHLTVDDLIALRMSGVTSDYIDQMRSIGLGTLSLNDLIALRMQGVTPDYVRGLRKAGVDVTSAENVIALRMQGVSGDYIAGMRAAGYDKLSTKELIALRMQGVTPHYVQEMANAGYKNLSATDLIELRSQGVSATFVKVLADAGYTNLSVRDLVRLAASGVSADFIRDLSKYRSKP